MPDLTEIIQKIAIWVLPVLFTFTVHAMTTAWIADRLGDRTPRMLGRLSLNPFDHVDPMGTVVVPLLCIGLGGFVIGWPKRVPMDARNFSYPRKGLAIVSLGGIGSNFVMAVAWALVLKFTLDSGVLSPIALGVQLMAQAGVLVNLAFFAISLLPIPPLPGGLLAKSLMPERVAKKLDAVESYMSIILIVLILAGVFSPYMLTIMGGLQNFIFTLLGVSDFRAF